MSTRAGQGSHLNALVRVTDDEVRRLCGYLTNDKTIADYLGIPIDRVQRARSTMPKWPMKGGSWGYKRKSEEPGTDGRRLVMAAAKEGSDALLRALLRYGLRHDGLPGLTAEAFRERCRDVGLAAA